MAILLFIFFLVVFILMLVGSKILNSIKDAKKAVEEAADLREQRLRNETARQRQQYSQRQQPQNSQSTQDNQNTQNSQNSQSTQYTQTTENDNARRTETATGETIIDHHHEHRENNRIFNDEDGEYVEFEEA